MLIMAHDLEARTAAALREWAERWAEAWQWTAKKGAVELQISRRMTRGLGKCMPEQRVIRLNHVLLDEVNVALLRETWCHELAHQVVFDRYGAGSPPHGQLWGDLMRAAGFEPRVRIPMEQVVGLPKASRGRGYQYLHQCTDCGKQFVTQRTDRRWRCAACRATGGEGRLIRFRKSA